MSSDPTYEVMQTEEPPGPNDADTIKMDDNPAYQAIIGGGRGGQNDFVKMTKNPSYAMP